MQSTDKQASSHGSGSSGIRSPRKSSVSSSAETFDTDPTSVSTRPRPSQQDGEFQKEEEPSTQPFDDFDLAAPVVNPDRGHPLEILLDMLCSPEHMASIFEEPSALEDFAAYIRNIRSQSLPLLTYYMEMSKAMKALDYANAVAKALGPLAEHEFTSDAPRKVVSTDFEKKAAAAFSEIVRDDLPPYLTQKYCQAIESIMINRILGSNESVDIAGAEGLTEVFCLSDPTRDDNPVVFASRGFCEITQYGLNYVNGKNCRFLQGMDSRSCLNIMQMV